MKHSVVTSDVLVIGGSGAGVMSALAAAKEGASVVMAVKGKVGKSGNAIMLGGSFGVDGVSARKYCGEPEANADYTPEKLFEKLVSCGFQIGDQRLQKHFVEMGPIAVAELLEWVKEIGDRFVFSPKASRWRAGGVAFGRALKHGLEQNREILVYEDTFISDLLTCGGQVCGAVGMNVYTGELVEFKAKAVILCTGGYQPHSLKNTISDMTGDGIAMALRAGAKAKDMEFLLYIPTIVEPAYARGSLLPFQCTMPNLFPIREKATDLDGDELVYSKDPKYKTNASNSKVKKLLMQYFYGEGMYKKWDQYGNRFYFDYSAYSEKDIYDAFEEMARQQSHWHRKGKYHFIDLKKLAGEIIANGRRWMVGFGNEYSMGGVVVDDTFFTGVPGLYAAGEVTSGLFGAFRSGDGLTEMLANGKVAGRSAGLYAAGAAQLEPDNLAQAAGALTAPLERTEGVSPVEAMRRIEAVCDEGFNFYRDGQRLEKAYTEICQLRRSLDQMAAPGGERYNLEWMNSIAARNLALCAESGLYSALHRTESRGCHLRSDCPQVDNTNFRYSFAASLHGGELEYEKAYPEAVYQPLDDRDYPDVGECIVKTILEVE